MQDIEDIVLKEIGGTPVFIRDVAQVTVGHAVRYGAVIREGITESAGGIVMMIRGGNAKKIVSEVKARVQEINAQKLLPGDFRSSPTMTEPNSWMPRSIP